MKSLTTCLCLVLISFAFSYQATGQSFYRKNIDSLKVRLKEDMSDSLKIVIYVQLGKSYQRVLLDSMKYFSEQAVELSEELNFDYGMAYAYNLYGWYFEEVEDYQNAIKYHKFTIQKGIAAQNPNREADGYLGVGRTFQRMRKADSAKYYVLLAVPIFEKQKNWTKLGATYNTLGIISRTHNQYDESIEYYLKALAAFEKSGNEELLADTYMNIGNVYYYTKTYEKAIEQYQIALKRAEDLGYLRVIGSSLGNIGECYTLLEDYTKALDYQKRALEVKKKAGSKSYIASALLNMVSIYINLKDYSNALSYLNEAEPLVKDFKQDYWQYSFYKYQAIVQQGLQNFNQAEESFQKAWAKAQNLRDQSEKINLLKEMSAFHEERGDYQLALQEYQTFKKLEDSIFNIEKTKKITELQTLYETAEKEREIASLKQKDLQNDIKLAKAQRNNTFYISGILILVLIGGFYFYQYSIKQRANNLLKIKNQVIESQNTTLKDNQVQLTTALNDKEVLLKEIHHRVKNNLQVISSLLAVQAQKYDHPAIEEFVANGRTRVQSMALVHQFLYQGEDSAQIAFGEYIKSLANFILNFHEAQERVELDLRIEDVQLDIDTAIPLGLISNELLTNALKHAFPDGKKGIISIELHEQNEEVIMMITDNGKGISPEDWEKANSFGMRLVQNLVAKIKGSLNLDSSSGTRFSLQFKNNILPVYE